MMMFHIARLASKSSQADGNISSNFPRNLNSLFEGSLDKESKNVEKYCILKIII